MDPVSFSFLPASALSGSDRLGTRYPCVGTSHAFADLPVTSSFHTTLSYSWQLCDELPVRPLCLFADSDAVLTLTRLHIVDDLRLDAICLDQASLSFIPKVKSSTKANFLPFLASTLPLSTPFLRHRPRSPPSSSRSTSYLLMCT